VQCQSFLVTLAGGQAISMKAPAGPGGVRCGPVDRAAEGDGAGAGGNAHGALAPAATETEFTKFTAFTKFVIGVDISATCRRIAFLELSMQRLVLMTAK
jgi:hypothetical protein